MTNLVEIRIIDAVAILTMRHGKVNAIDLELLNTLDDALDQVHTAGARAVVLTGAGTAFSAGVDLFRVLEGRDAYLEQFLPALRETLSRLAFLDLPVVAAVNGHAIAGGFVLLAAADRAVMAEGPGRIGTTELLVGVAFPAIALELVRVRAGDAQSIELILDGTTFGCAEALARRLIDASAPADALVDRAIGMARRLADSGPAFVVTKQQLRQPVMQRVRALDEWEQRVDAVWRSPETLARIQAYIDSTIRHRK